MRGGGPCTGEGDIGQDEEQPQLQEEPTRQRCIWQGAPFTSQAWDRPPLMSSCPIWMLLQQKRGGQCRRPSLCCLGPEVAVTQPELVNAQLTLQGTSSETVE